MNSEDQCLCEIDEKKQKADNILKQSIYDKTVKMPKIEKVSTKCPNLPLNMTEFPAMDIEKILVEYKIRKPKAANADNIAKSETKKVEKGIKDVPTMSECDAFRLAGFQQDWTKEKVKNMLKSDDGRALLERVDREFKRLTGKNTIKESDILQCYPNYLKKTKNIQLSIKLDD